MTAKTAVFLLAAATMLVVALSTGSAVYYLVFAAMVIMLAISFVSALLALWTVRVSSTCAAKTVERGERIAASIRIRHLSPLPVKSISVLLSTPEREGASQVIELFASPMRGKSYDVTLKCPHRGVYQVGVSSITVLDLFELFRMKRRIKQNHFDIVVLPRTERIQPLDLRSGENGPEYMSKLTEDNASPSDVRSWQDGDPMKRVHWKLSMRKRELMVRNYEDSARPDTLVLVDLSAPGSALALSLSVEDAICETAATIALAQLSASYPVRMPLMNASPIEVTGQTSAEGMRFVEALARVRFDLEHSFDQVLTLELRRIQRTGGVVIVTSRLSARIADVASQMRRMGLQICVAHVSDAAREETDELISRMLMIGVVVKRVNPFLDKPLNQET